MIEAILFSFIAGLFLYEVVILRMLMKRQVDKTLKTLVNDWDQETQTEKVLVPSRPFVLQESVKRVKR